MASSPHRSYLDAEIGEIVHVLRRYDVLTGSRLAALCGAERWHSSSTFKLALAQGIAQNRIRRLGDDLYELTDDERL